MTLILDRADIQGNVLLPYSRTRFPIGRLLLLHHNRSRGGDAACRFLQDLIPEITSSQLFESKRTRRWAHIRKGSLHEAPRVLVNVAFTARGLHAFDVPEATLNGMPLEFLEGMKKRAVILHDNVETWDPIWREQGEHQDIHIAILLRVNFTPCLQAAYKADGCAQRDDKDYHPARVFKAAHAEAVKIFDQYSCNLIERAGQCGELQLLQWPGNPSDRVVGEGRGSMQWFETESLVRTRKQDGILGMTDNPEGREDDCRYGEHEHFGFFDGSADPVFEGQFPRKNRHRL